MVSNWSLESWKNFEILQQPTYENVDIYNINLQKLSSLPSLVFSGETRLLQSELNDIDNNDKFILQIGDCSESFNDCNGPKIHNYLRLFLQMSKIIEFNNKADVIKIGRIAGQYAKPRSSDFEIINNIKLPVYRGDNVNNFEPTLSDRKPDPDKLLKGYFHSVATLNLIRAFISGGYSDINHIADWENHFYASDLSKIKRYDEFKLFLNKTLTSNLQSKSDIIYTSHEALILGYEQAFIRKDTVKEGNYSTSAHTLWIGERTRQFNSAHVELLSGIENPIGIKVGPNYQSVDLVSVIKKLNPRNLKGKIQIITRFGHDKILNKLEELLNLIKSNNLNVIWICDPMHGNTFNYKQFKVRSFDDIVSEIKSFFYLCKENGIKPSGVHLEVTPNYVSECVGGMCGLTFNNIGENYCTKVDPRLNTAQALEVAFIINQLI